MAGVGFADDKDTTRFQCQVYYLYSRRFLCVLGSKTQEASDRVCECCQVTSSGSVLLYEHLADHGSWLLPKSLRGQRVRGGGRGGGVTSVGCGSGVVVAKCIAHIPLIEFEVSAASCDVLGLISIPPPPQLFLCPSLSNKCTNKLLNCEVNKNKQVMLNQMFYMVLPSRVSGQV